MEQSIGQSNVNQPMPKQSKKIPSWVGFVIIIAFALIAFGGVFAYQYFLPKESKIAERGPKLIGGDKDSHGCLAAAGYSWCEVKSKCLRTWEEPCEIVQTAGWKTYTNEQSGLSFQYPQAWGEPKIVSLSTKIAGSFPDGSIGQYDNGFTFELGVYYDQTIGKNFTVEELIDNIKNQSYISNAVQKNIIVGGRNATQVEYTYKTGGTITEVYISLDTKGNIFQASSDTSLIGVDTFNKIISILKFLLPMDYNSGWKPITDSLKTYSSKDWGISFDYPAELGAPSVQDNILFFTIDGQKSYWDLDIRKNSTTDAKKNWAEYESCLGSKEEANSTMGCYPAQTLEEFQSYFNKIKEVISSGVISEADCHRCERCEIIKTGKTDILFSHNCWSEGGPIDSRIFILGNNIFSSYSSLYSQGNGWYAKINQKILEDIFKSVRGI